jgi:hypothetical protein
MNSLILMAALAFVPAAICSQNSGCDQCDCCGCCETGSCECRNCTCVCCVDECPTAGVKAERKGCCGSGCYGR